MNVSQFCKKYSIDRKTLYNLKKRGIVFYDKNRIDESEGIDALWELFETRDISKSKNPEWRPPERIPKKPRHWEWIAIISLDILRQTIPQIKNELLIEDEIKIKIDPEFELNNQTKNELVNSLIEVLKISRDGRLEYYKTGEF